MSNHQNTMSSQRPATLRGGGFSAVALGPLFACSAPAGDPAAAEGGTPTAFPGSAALMGDWAGVRVLFG